MDGQDTWFSSAAATSTATWKIAFGHHTYISNGHHGNAGVYDGLPMTGSASDALRGTEVEAFVNDYVCGVMDVYFCGHDHNRQWLDSVCGTEFIVSGSAAKTSNIIGGSNSTLFEDDQKAGFMWIEIEDNCLRGEFYDSNAVLDFEHEVCQ